MIKHEDMLELLKMEYDSKVDYSEFYKKKILNISKRIQKISNLLKNYKAHKEEEYNKEEINNFIYLEKHYIGLIVISRALKTHYIAYREYIKSQIDKDLYEKYDGSSIGKRMELGNEVLKRYEITKSSFIEIQNKENDLLIESSEIIEKMYQKI